MDQLGSFNISEDEAEEDSAIFFNSELEEKVNFEL